MSRFVFILILMLISVSTALSANNIADKERLEKELQLAQHDTIKISILFKLGKLYYNGPSDSVIHFNKKALLLIEQFFDEQIKKTEKPDERLVNTYEKLHFKALLNIALETFYQGKFEKALEISFKAMDVANRRNDAGSQSEILGVIGMVYKNQGKYAEAIEYYENSLKSAIQYGDTSWIAACYANAGNMHRRLTNYAKAQEYLIEALREFEKSNNKSNIATTNMNIGILYDDQKEYEKALFYYNKAIEIARELDDKKTISRCLTNIGDTYIQQNDYSRARQYFEQSLQLNLEMKYEYFLDQCYQNIGSTYEKEGQYDQAIENYEKALQLAIKNDNYITVSAVQGNLSNIYLEKKQFKKALRMAEMSLRSNEKTNDLWTKKDACLYLSQSYSGLGDNKNALKYFQLYSNVKDSIFDSEKYESLKELEVKYETEKKENQLALLSEQNRVQELTLEKRNRLILGTTLFFTLSFLIVLLLTRQKRMKEKHEALVLEQKLLRTQMSPHFVFNSLIAIQNYIYNNKPLVAGDYLARFADLIRTALDGSRNDFIQLDREIRMMKTYLELQKLRFENAFDYNLIVDDKLNLENTNIPPMFAQPFVENAIEHGLRHLSGQGKLEVVYSQKRECCISIAVIDNGVGRQKSQQLENKAKHQSQAITITRERLDVLSKHFRQHFQFQIDDLYDENKKPSGVKVTIDIPTQ